MTFCLVDFGLSGGIPWLKGTDRALHFSVNMKLKIEFIFFCDVHNLQKIGNALPTLSKFRGTVFV